MNHLTFDELLKYAKRTIRDMHDENGNIKSEYVELREKIENHCSMCSECRETFNQLQQANSLEEIERIRNKFEHKEQKEELSEEEIISKKYGINVDSIEHIKLNDGKEYYHFYDIRLNKDIVLKQSSDNKNMSEELKEVQEGLSSAQGADEKENGEEAFRYQRMHTNNEIDLYSVEELTNRPEILGRLNVEQMKAVLVLLKNKDILNIKEINPETGIAIDDKHKVITSYYNKSTQKYEVDLPNEYQYKTDTVSAEQTEEISQNNYIDDISNKTDDIPNEIDGILIDRERVKLYYEYPELLEGGAITNQQEKQAYIKAVQIYSELQEQKQSGSQMSKPKILVKKDKNCIVAEDDLKQAGFINLLLLSLATGFAGGVITTIMYMIIK